MPISKWRIFLSRDSYVLFLPSTVWSRWDDRGSALSDNKRRKAYPPHPETPRMLQPTPRIDIISKKPKTFILTTRGHKDLTSFDFYSIADTLRHFTYYYIISFKLLYFALLCFALPYLTYFKITRIARHFITSNFKYLLTLRDFVQS